MAENALTNGGNNSAHNNDPSRNVLDLVDAAIQRQDDLRAAESRHVREIASLRAEYAQELRETETARIDAIRRVDVEAVQRAAEVQATQATALAGQVSAAAEAMRTQVAAAASAATIALAAALEPVQKDIADLRRAQYEAQGEKGQRVETQDRVQPWAIWASGAAMTVAVVLVTVLANILSQ